MNSSTQSIEQILLSKTSVKYPDGTNGLLETTLAVRRGQSLVILGPSGAGKSTLLRVLGGVQQPTSGSVSWETATGSPVASIWPQLSIVYQKFFLWPHLTVERNLALPLGKRGRPSLDSSLELLQRLQIDGLLNRYSHELSVGQQQRVALARTLILRPRFLLVDEVSSALDPESTSQVYEILGELNKQGTTIVAITHLPGLASSYFAEYVYIDKGEVLADGRTSSLNQSETSQLRRYLSIASLNSYSGK